MSLLVVAPRPWVPEWLSRFIQNRGLWLLYFFPLRVLLTERTKFQECAIWECHREVACAFLSDGNSIPVCAYHRDEIKAGL